MNKKVINIVLVNYNGWKDTIECVDSILKSNENHTKNIIIVDNNSNDNSLDYIQNFIENCKVTIDSNIFSISKVNYEIHEYLDNKFTLIKKHEKDCNDNKKIFIIKNHTNNGFSMANNIGIKFSNKYLQYDYIWILNNDTIIEKESIDQLVKFSEEDGDKSFIGVTILEYYDRDKIQCTCGVKYNVLTTIGKNVNQGKNICELDNLEANFTYISGCAIFGHKILFEKINNFSEDYFLYYEELDLMKKAQKENIELKWCRNSLIYHKGGASIGSKNIKNQKSRFSEYYSNKSCFTYYKKYYKKTFYFIIGLRYLLKYVKYTLEKNKELKTELKKSYKDFFKNQ